MNDYGNAKLLNYLGRFVPAFLVSYAVAAVLFLPLQNLLPAENRSALDFFEPYRLLGMTTAIAQFIRALVLALVLYPFYQHTVRARRAPLVLFSALWGLSFVGSIQPMPGSFEGLIYTETGAGEHLLVLAAGALQAGICILMFLPWQRKSDVQGKLGITEEGARNGTERSVPEESSAPMWGVRLKGYLPRFVLLYVAVYIVAGMIFYQLSGYEEALAEMEAFELYRPLENPAMGAAVFLGQFLRGSLLALMLAPFVMTCLRRRRTGSLLFFALFFGTTVLGGPIFIPDLLTGIGETTAKEFFIELSAGVPEIVAQLLLFSLLFIGWMQQLRRKRATKTQSSSVPV